MGDKMINVRKIEEKNMADLEKFLKSVESIKDVELEVLKNAVFIQENDDILGMISFEIFNKHGLIRYFVFKKNIVLENIYEMFRLLEESAIESDLKSLFSIVNEDKIIELFKQLDFNEIDKNYFFIEEKNVLQTKYKESTILLKELNI